MSRPNTTNNSLFRNANSIEQCFIGRAPLRFQMLCKGISWYNIMSLGPLYTHIFLLFVTNIVSAQLLLGYGQCGSSISNALLYKYQEILSCASSVEFHC